MWKMSRVFSGYANYYSTVNNKKSKQPRNFSEVPFKLLKSKKFTNDVALICRKRQFILSNMQIIILPFNQ